MRVPVVAFDLDGTAEAITTGTTGHLVPADRPDQLMTAIIDLITDPEKRRRYGLAAREKCLPRFDHHRMVHDLEALYTRIAARAAQ
jgi:glycosyltransferase involved in cell wall biosynthesis